MGGFIKTAFRIFILRILYCVVNNRFRYFFLVIKFPVISSRLKQIEMEIGSDDDVLRNISVLNMLHRNGAKVVGQLLILLDRYLDREVINLRWVVSSLDTMVDEESISVEVRSIALFYSSHINTLKFYDCCQVGRDPQEKFFGLSSFTKNGDMFLNQRRRAMLLLEYVSDPLVAKVFLKLDERLCAVFQALDIEYGC